MDAAGAWRPLRGSRIGVGARPPRRSDPQRNRRSSRLPLPPRDPPGKVPGPICGRVPKWPKGTGCKPVGVRLRRFESCSAH